MNHYDIKITFDGRNAKPSNKIPEMRVGDTVQYFSDEGEVLIVFPGPSPFRIDDEPGTFVHGGYDMPLRQRTPDQGVPCRCFVRPQGRAQFIGWRAGSGADGGNHVVK